MREKPRILHTETLARTRLFHVQQIDLRFSNGVETRYERLVGSSRGAVLVVPLLDDDTVLLIREYAAGVDRYELALPKGHIEQDEDMLLAADRELKEEVGYGARSLTRLSSMSLAPGYLGHYTHVVLARDLYPDKRSGDEPEEIEVVPWRLSELNALVARHDFTEARSIAALFLTREHLNHA
ncbi:MAG: ADP compounds hydrolase NudE [Gammaproteobacteria bacterium]|nr:ADP compounds hydrolase NudE [Gammaproteobacteria bacterium]